MTTLIIHAPDKSQSSTPEIAFGGLPSAPDGVLDWPACRACNGNMQFLGQLRQTASDALLLLFMCQNDPGCCDEWDPNSGGNKVLHVAASGLALVQAPATGEVTRPTRYGATLIDQPEDDYDDARSAWTTSSDRGPREVLGQFGGTPAWIQGEETPACDSCGHTMTFFAQLEQGPDWETEMNFGGGGCAYVFHCTCGPENAKLLWQC